MPDLDFQILKWTFMQYLDRYICISIGCMCVSMWQLDGQVLQATICTFE